VLKLFYIFGVSKVYVRLLSPTFDILLFVVNDGIEDIDYVLAGLAGEYVADILAILKLDVLLIAAHGWVDEFLVGLVPCEITHQILAVLAVVTRVVLVEQAGPQDLPIEGDG
jgi:hypothetical protein